MILEEQLSPQHLPDDLRLMIAQRYGLVPGQSSRLFGGDECVIWKVASCRGPFVVRIIPAFRSPERLIWIHQLTRTLQTIVPEVVAPLSMLNGNTLFHYGDQSVALFPFISGAQLERENPVLRQAAASLLARLHTILLRTISHPVSLEREMLIGEPPLPAAPDLDALVDLELDAWHTTLLQQPDAFTIGLIHGDYYRRNLLTQGEHIIGLLDWDDLHHDFLMQEVAWSTWELCKTPDGDDWYLDRVQSFISHYREAGGPCKPEEYRAMIPFIRWRLRQEIRRHLAAVASGLPGEPEYAAKELRAFERLRRCTIPY